MNNNSSKSIIREEIVVPDQVAQYIKNNINKDAFKPFKKPPGCALQAPQDNCPRDHRGLWLILTGSQDENNARIDPILDLLTTTELKLLNEEDEDRRALINFMVIVRMLIPEQKVGFVAGTQFATLQKIEMDWEVKAQLDKQCFIPVPTGFSRLILRSSRVEGLRQARIEILRIQQLALPINPRGLADGRAVDANEEVRERIEMPLFNMYNEEQKQRIREIQKWATDQGIDHRIDKNELPANGRYLLLRGPSAVVIECKRRFATLLKSMENEKNIGNGTGTKRLPRRSDEYRESLEMLIPFPTFQEVIGRGGETIRALQQELGVHLIFLGQNEDEYPDGRWLRILGPSEEKCHDAKAHIEREYVDKRRQPEQKQQQRREPFDWNEQRGRDDGVQMEMRLPEDICRSVIQKKKKCVNFNGEETSSKLMNSKEGDTSHSQNSSLSSAAKSTDFLSFMQEKKSNQNDLQQQKKKSSDAASSDMVEDAISAQMVDDDDDFVEKRGQKEKKVGSNKQKEDVVVAKEVDSAFEREKEEEEYNDDEFLGGDDISSFKATTNTQWGSDLDDEEDQVDKEEERTPDDDDENTQDDNNVENEFNAGNFDKQMLESLSFIQTFGMQVEEFLEKYKAVCKENKALVKENGRLLLKLKLKKAAEGEGQSKSCSMMMMMKKQ